MDFDTFAARLCSSLPEGIVLNNPGGGTSTVMWCDGERLCYKRGESRLYISLAHLHDAFRRFRGRSVTTNDLKELAPEVYDSNRNGHSCHCTFFFMALKQMGVIDRVRGAGRAGNPFRVRIPSEMTSLVPARAGMASTADGHGDVRDSAATVKSSAGSCSCSAPLPVARRVTQALHKRQPVPQLAKTSIERTGRLQGVKLILEIGVGVVTLIGGIIALIYRVW